MTARQPASRGVRTILRYRVERDRCVRRSLVHVIDDDLEQQKVLGRETNAGPDDNAVVDRRA